METEIINTENSKSLIVRSNNGNSWKAKETFNDGSYIIFPFKYTEKSGVFEARYKSISSIKLGAKVVIKKGLYRNINFGLGFTSKAREIVVFIEKHFPNITQIEILNNDDYCKVEEHVLKFSLKAFTNLIQTLYSVKDFHKREITEDLGHEFCAYFYPDIEFKETEYQSDDIYNRYLIYDNFENLSEKDLETIEKFIPYFSSKTKSDVLIKTKEAVDIVYIENVLAEFSELIESQPKTKGAITNLEKKWHDYFKKNSWLLAQLFYSPVTLIQDEAFVGGKGLNNKDGKLADFVYKNSFDSISIIEIKTHLTALMESKSYRGTDVYATTKDLSGGISQVLNQKHNFYVGFTQLRYNSDIDFEALNPTCILLMGKLANLNKKQLKSFELYRNGMKDVVIVTFDELQKKIDNLLSILKNEI